MGMLAMVERVKWVPLQLSRHLSTSAIATISPSKQPPPYAKKPEDMEDVCLPPGIDGPNTKGLRKLAYSNIFVGPHAGRCPATLAEFVKSSTKEMDCPKDGLPEFALVGRSNVGKSSLLNALVRRRRLAKTSKTPGKTQLINHFIIDKSWYLVDLPGYGFAEAPVEARKEWEAFTKNYLIQRKTLVSVLLLIDASVLPKTTDLVYAEWLHSKKIPMTIVFTKSDKRRKRARSRTPEDNVRDFEKKTKIFLSKVPPWIMTSCKTNQGRDELLTHLAQLRKYWKAGLVL